MSPPKTYQEVWAILEDARRSVRETLDKEEIDPRLSRLYERLELLVTETDRHWKRSISPISVSHVYQHIHYIVEVVAEYYTITVLQLLGKSRKAEFVRPRHIAIYLCKTHHPDITWVYLAAKFKRNHATIIHAYNLISSQVDIDRDITKEVNHLLTQIS